MNTGTYIAALGASVAEAEAYADTNTLADLEVQGDALTKFHNSTTGWSVTQAERSIWERVSAA